VPCSKSYLVVRILWSRRKSRRVVEVRSIDPVEAMRAAFRNLIKQSYPRVTPPIFVSRPSNSRLRLTHRSIMASTAQSVLSQIPAPVRELVEATSESAAFGKSDLERKEITEWLQKIAGGGVSESSLKVRLN
jgi:hypothetical protein